MINREQVSYILDEVKRLVNGPRAQTHGDNTFEDMAALASAYLKIPVTPAMASTLMTLFKIARTMSGDKTHEDHYIDATAYTAIAGSFVITPEEKQQRANQAMHREEMIIKTTGPYGTKEE